MYTSVYSIQTPEEALDCVAAGVDHVGLLIGDDFCPACISLEQAKAVLQKKPELTAKLSAAAKAKRIDDRSNHAYRWVAMAIMLAGFVALIYGIRSLVQKDSSGLYFLLLGLAAIFLFSGLHVRFQRQPEAPAKESGAVAGFPGGGAAGIPPDRLRLGAGEVLSGP